MSSSLYPKVNTDPPSPKQPKQGPTSPQNTIHPLIAKSDAVLPQYQGKPGPQSQRKCHDLFFLVLFVLYWIGMFIIAGLSIKDGNLNRLKYGNDSDGNLCGTLNYGLNGSQIDLSDKKYQYTLNPFSPLNSTRICVKTCPTATGDVICDENLLPIGQWPQKTQSDFLSFFHNGTCSLTLASTQIMMRCIPQLNNLTQVLDDLQLNNTLTNGFAELDSRDTATKLFSDIYQSWKVILICSGIALVLSFIWLFLLKYTAGVIVYLTLLLINVINIGFTAYLFYNYTQVKNGNEANQYITTVLKSSGDNEKVLLALSSIMAIIAGIIFLLTVGLRKRIGLAISIMKETSKAVRAMPMIMFLPVFKYIAITLLTSWTIYIFAMLATSGSLVSSKVPGQISSRTKVEFQSNTIYQYLIIYYVLGYFWTFNFLVAISQTTIAGAIASYYWTLDKKSLPCFPILTSLKRTLFYHLGSLAFGSFILALIETIRAIILYFQVQLRKRKESKVAQNILACCQCCFGCIEKLVKFLNKNAYIEIAVYGYSFCEASKMAFQLLVRNAIRVVVIDKLSDFILFLSKLFITLVTAFIGTYLLQNPQLIGLSTSEMDLGRFWTVPLILIGILSYMIASNFMSVFEMSIQTIFLCFCEDSERNDGSADRPYYMEPGLKEFVDQASKQKPSL